MATRKRLSGDTRKAAAYEFRFKIDAFTPETMPMARLLEYLGPLATVLGEPNAVHFMRVERGSTVPVLKIEREALPKVRDRATSIRRGEAPRDALVAFRTINKLLREDNGVAVLQEKRAATPILRFPGREEAQERFPAIRQSGTIDGEIRRVGGWDETVPVLLRSEGKHIVGCWANEHIARQLGARLFEPVRLYGRGKWTRDAEGEWALEEFKIEGFDFLQKEPLSSALTKLRAIGGEWGKGAYKELAKIRHGPVRKANGGS